jgi:hypothetical protein
VDRDRNVMIIGEIAKAKSISESRDEAGEQTVPRGGVAKDVATGSTRVEESEEIKPTKVCGEPGENWR